MKNFVLCLCLLVMSMPANAAAQAKADDFELMKQAVEYSAQADVYNAHCKQESSLAKDFIDKFEEKRALSSQQKNELIALQAQHRLETENQIKETGEGCKGLEFMMRRLEVMRKLKDVSYLLNGVDPSTLPQDNIPDLEHLLPPKTAPAQNFEIQDL